jgi:enamine deaminase RidA (YjgF/YER057c/UK114 family)
MVKPYHVCKIDSQDVSEVFVSAIPQTNVLPDQVEQVYAQIANELATQKARVFQERIFATQAAMDTIEKVRRQVLGDQVDEVPPSYLVCDEGQTGPLSGVQIHAIKSPTPPEIITTQDNRACGRVFRTPACDYLGLSALTMPDAGTAPDQAYAMFAQAQTILQSFGADFLYVPRTWLWLGNILDWYDGLNQARNRFFTELGILGTKKRQPMPASTGIGLGPANGAACAMDLTAILKPQGRIEYIQAGGKQQSAYEYGSAFSRASKAPTPAGFGVFISGTASIDADGKTTNIDDARAQIEDTIVNVKAVLRDMDCPEKDVVHVMAYCKTPEVETLFRDLAGKPDWPWIPMICDVCRDDLLFEIEALAMPQA